MNTNPNAGAAAKKRKPLAEKQQGAAVNKQPNKPKAVDGAAKPSLVKKTGVRTKPLTPKQKRLKKIQMRVAKVNNMRRKMKEGDQEMRKEIEKVVDTLTKKKEKSKHQKRKLSMYRNMLSGNFVVKEPKKSKENKRTGKSKPKGAASATAPPPSKAPVGKSKQEKPKKGKPQAQK